MGITERLSRLIRANLNHQIDRAEDPEIMLEQVLRDMRANTTSARNQLRDMIAQVRVLEADLTHAHAKTVVWQQRAESAAMAGRDDLARAALRGQRDSAANEEIYAQQITAQNEIVNRLKGQVQQLESRYQSALSRKDALVARQRRAKATMRIQEYGDGSLQEELGRFERTIRRSEARSAASIEIHEADTDTQFLALDDPIIEGELRTLKRRLALTVGGDESLDDPELPGSRSTPAIESGPS